MATEAFFVQPLRLRESLPDLYDELKQFYRQDPAALDRSPPRFDTRGDRS